MVKSVSMVHNITSCVISENANLSIWRSDRYRYLQKLKITHCMVVYIPLSVDV